MIHCCPQSRMIDGRTDKQTHTHMTTIPLDQGVIKSIKLLKYSNECKDCKSRAMIKVYYRKNPLTESRYSTALSGLLKLALNALITWSRSNPMHIISCTVFSYDSPVTRVLSAADMDASVSVPEGWQDVLVVLVVASTVPEASCDTFICSSLGFSSGLVSLGGAGTGSVGAEDAAADTPTSGVDFSTGFGLGCK